MLGRLLSFLVHFVAEQIEIEYKLKNQSYGQQQRSRSRSRKHGIANIENR